MLKLRKNRRAALTSLVAAAVAAGAASVPRILPADQVIYDNLTPADAGSTTAMYYYSSSPTFNYEGDAYNLLSGATDITGFDLFPAQVTSQSLTGIQVNVTFWGTVNTGTVSPTAPAFSNALATASVDVTGTFNSGFYYFFENGANRGIKPFITFTNPVALSGTGPIGVSFNLKGTTDGTTYNNINGLDETIATGAGAVPVVGSNVFTSFYVNHTAANASTAGTDTNGNFTQGRLTYGLTNQAFAIRIFGDTGNNGVTGGDKSWANAVSGSWTNASSWTPLGIPNSTSAVTFNLSSPTPYTASITSAQAVNSGYVYNDKVNIDLNGSSAQLSSSANFTVGYSDGSVSNVSGTLLLTRSNGTSAATVTIGGQLQIGASGGVGQVVVGNLVYLKSTGDINLDPGGKLNISAGGKVATTNLNLAGGFGAWTSLVDIGKSAINLPNGDLITVINQVKQGFNAGGAPWAGTGGITSAAAAADSGHKTAVAVIANNDGTNQLYGTGTALGLFDGVSPSFSDVLVRYTYFGDANLDGKVDGSDYTRIDNGFLNGGTGWFNGDFNYDGVVDASDYTLIDNAYNTQLGLSTPIVSPFVFGRSADGASFSGSVVAVPIGGASIDSGGLTASPTALVAGTSAVPEPATLALLAIAPLAPRRRRGVGRN